MPVTAVLAQTRPHVLRPDLPWRTSDLTECGLQADVRECITRDELAAMIAHDGRTRTTHAVCSTCFAAAQRWPTWSEDPVRAAAREFYNSRHHPRLGDELRAIAALVDRHRSEFDDMAEGLSDVPSLAAARRAARRARSAPSSRPVA